MFQYLGLPESAGTGQMWARHGELKKPLTIAARSSDTYIKEAAAKELEELRQVAKSFAYLEARELDKRPGGDMAWGVSGASFVEGTLEKWLKRNGRTVARDEPICVVETGPSSVTIKAPRRGMLRVPVPAGEQIAPGTLLARIVVPPPADGAPAGEAKPDK